MTISENSNATSRKPLRLWPGLTLAIVQVAAWFGLPRVLDEEWKILGFFVPVVAGLLIVLWWLFLSRAPWRERLGYLVLMIAAVAATSRLIHISVAQTSMGIMFYVLTLVLVPFAFVGGLAVSRARPGQPRHAVLVASILVACGVFTLLRNEGVGSAGFEFKWRWSPTPEEKLLAQGGDKPLPPLVSPAAAPAQPAPAAEQPAAGASNKAERSPAAKAPAVAAAMEPATKWPGFRGANRDGIVPGLRIETNWAAAPPKEMWRRPVGPGWSSFAVRGEMVYTQEQRGESEVVSCYDLKTGKPVWEHRDAVRFWEANAGAGPRATPTLHANRLYTFGATGLLNALDADTGARVWTRDVAKDADKKAPYWGFSSSPLVLNDLVVVSAGGRLAAFDRATGNPRWLGPNRAVSYSSPHLLSVDGVEQVAVLTGDGITSVAPADGKVLWEHAWAPGGTTMLQPARSDNGDLLLTAGSLSGGEGMRRITVTHTGDAWLQKEHWTSRGLKPYFNDFVVHKGHAYGFDGTILSCIELEKGERKWKGGRYGQGQLLLLREQDLLLVISEEGELALVSATPDGFKELGRAPAIEGKTWNHLALVDDVLLVRNDREMAAFRLSRASAVKPAAASTP
jgi:outer membrane protein assembly factor BamB